MVRRPRFHTRPRGSTAIEFVLMVPTLLLLVTGFFEFSWAFFQHDIMTRAVRNGCRVGAVVPVDADPATSAQEAIAEYLNGSSFPCEGESCEATVTTHGESPDRFIACEVVAEFQPLTGVIPLVDDLPLKSATRLRVEW